MADNIGGIVSVEYCLVTSVNTCGVTGRGLHLSYSRSNPWTAFKSGLGHIQLDVVRDGTGLHKVSGEIRCARHLFANREEMNFPDGKKILVRKTLANGDILVSGDLENPISVTAEILTPSEASGFSGVRYTLSGTMNHPELPVL